MVKKIRRIVEHDIDTEDSWKYWFRHVYSKYLYVIICIFVDVMSIGQIKVSAPIPTPGYIYVLMIVFLIIEIILEVLIYRALWWENKKEKDIYNENTIPN